VTWEWLCTPPHPVTIDGRAIPGLPDRPIPLDEIRARLLARRCPADVRDAVWAHLVRHSRTEGSTWTVAAAGMALPVLTRVARILTAKYASDHTDIHAAVLSGFLTGLTRVDPDRPAVLVSLRWAAYRGGLAAVREALRAPTPVGAHRFESTAPRPVACHPDLVLARAVADHVITHDEAALIGSTRLEHVRLADAATARGQTYQAANAARHRAERRLLAYLTTPDTTPDPMPDPVLDTVLDNLRHPAFPARRSTTAAPVRVSRRAARPADTPAAPTGHATPTPPEPAAVRGAPTRRRRARNTTRRQSPTVTNPVDTASATTTTTAATGSYGGHRGKPASGGAGDRNPHTVAPTHDPKRTPDSAIRCAAARACGAVQPGRRGDSETAERRAPGLLRSSDPRSENRPRGGVPLRGGTRAATTQAGTSRTATGAPSGTDHGGGAAAATVTGPRPARRPTGHPVLTGNPAPTGSAARADGNPDSAPPGRQLRGRGRRGRRATRPTTRTGSTATDAAGGVTDVETATGRIRAANAADPHPHTLAEKPPPGRPAEESAAAPAGKPAGESAMASVPGAVPPGARARRRGVAQLAVVLGVVGGLCVASAPVSALAFAQGSAPEAGVVVLAQAESIDQVLVNIRGWLMGILAGLATVMATVGGIRYVIADGDPGEIQRAKTAFRSAGIGFALAALAPLLVTILQGLVGL
jgi:hypothetical protein